MRVDLVQKEIQNPHASIPLIIPVAVFSNTPEARMRENVRTNAALPLGWLYAANQHDGIAVMVGGGPSAADHIETIRRLSADGATVFAMNAASQWLRRHGVVPDYQVMVDAQPRSADLVDPYARHHLFGSQVDPETMRRAMDPIVWHTAMDDIEDLFPPERVAKGGYVLLGGSAAVGTSGMCVAYALGFRDFRCFGYDSSNRADDTHAYPQPMNQFIPTVDVEWAGRTYTASVAMKLQAEQFQTLARELVRTGCRVDVIGDGLLPAMWNTPPDAMSERDKYRTIWQFDSYRDFSPGEHAARGFAAMIEGRGTVIDFGCGTGRGALTLEAEGFDPVLVDFAGNCRDDEAKHLPFVEWDLTQPIFLRAPYGFCCDVMEHVPAADVDVVIGNIMEAAGTVWFQISTVPDSFGDLIGATLHNTVRNHDWWFGRFGRLGFHVAWRMRNPHNSTFLVTRTLSERT